MYLVLNSKKGVLKFFKGSKVAFLESFDDFLIKKIFIKLIENYMIFFEIWGSLDPKNLQNMVNKSPVPDMFVLLLVNHNI